MVDRFTRDQMDRFMFTEREKQLIVDALESAIDWTFDSNEAADAQLLIYRIMRGDRGAALLGAAHGPK